MKPLITKIFFRMVFCFSGLVTMSLSAGAQVFIDSSQTINTDRRGNDFYTGVHANGVVLTVDVGAQINGSRFTSGIRSFNDSQVNILGGTVLGVDTLSNSLLRVFGGNVGTVEDRTEVFISGGNVTDLFLTSINNSNYNSVGIATVSGGTVVHSENQDGGTLLVNGGTVTKYLSNAGVNSVVNVRGGSIIGTVYSLDQYDTYNFYGSGLSFTNAVAGTTAANPDGPGGNIVGTYYDLNGTLSDGTRISTKYFATNNSTSQANLVNSSVPKTSVPEPGSLLLLATALGGLAFTINAKSLKRS